MVPVAITKLKKQLLDRIDIEDFMQVEKVERYIELVNSFRKISKAIRKEGETIVTENGSQKFTKAHPLIGERSKINTQLISLGKDLGTKYKTKDSPKEQEQGGYSASDLK